MEDDKVLSLSKLKTLEYRIYRKLREKLRIFISKKSMHMDESLRKFNQEVKDLCQNCAPAKPLSYYSRIAEVAFDFADFYPDQNYLIHEEYITFISIVIYCVENNERVKPKMFTEQKKRELLSIPWSSYNFQRVASQQQELSTPNM